MIALCFIQPNSNQPGCDGSIAEAEEANLPMNIFLLQMLLHCQAALHTSWSNERFLQSFALQNEHNGTGSQISYQASIHCHSTPFQHEKKTSFDHTEISSNSTLGYMHLKGAEITNPIMAGYELVME